VAGRKKKLPWNHGLKIPGLGGEPEHPPPKPMPIGSGPMGLTTGHMVPSEPQWECGRCENIREGLPPPEIAPDHSPRCPYRGTGRDPEPKG
jgi:hypothetical protein